MTSTRGSRRLLPRALAATALAVGIFAATPGTAGAVNVPTGGSCAGSAERQYSRVYFGWQCFRYNTYARVAVYDYGLGRWVWSGYMHTNGSEWSYNHYLNLRGNTHSQAYFEYYYYYAGAWRHVGEYVAIDDWAGNLWNVPSF